MQSLTDKAIDKKKYRNKEEDEEIDMDIRSDHSLDDEACDIGAQH